MIFSSLKNARSSNYLHYFTLFCNILHQIDVKELYL